MRQTAGSKARRKRTADLDKADMSKKLNLAFFSPFARSQGSVRSILHANSESSTWAEELVINIEAGFVCHAGCGLEAKKEEFDAVCH